MKKLNKYNEKRDFDKTSEPKGKLKKPAKKLRFVVQHHMSRKEHYDFRLEWKGTLKSWAVPKGPSYNPSDKRLAIEVEDHPIDYRNFEGNIPKGQYGGGSVMIWDEGYWEPFEMDEDNIKLTLYGKRLMGRWSLVKIKDNNWILIKKEDEYSNDLVDIKKYNTSIRTGKTMKEIEEEL